MQENRDTQTEQINLPFFNPVTIVRDILKRWYLVVVVALMAGMITYAATGLLYVPVYQTTTTFVVSAKGSSATVYQNLSATSNLAAVFSKVLNSSILRSAVLEELGMTGFDGTISASAASDTNLLTLKVTDSDPRTAFLVTRSIIENHHIVSYQVLGDTILEVLQSPKVPTSPINSVADAANMKKATVLTAAAMCLLLGALSAMKDTVRSKQEAERKLDCRVLGTIHHERKYKTPIGWLKRKKTSILVTNPTTSFLFVENFRKLRRKLELLMPAGGRVIMVTSVLENEGKSTVAVNLGFSLAQKDKKVLLIEGDLRKPACCKILDLPWRGAGTIGVIEGRAELRDAAVKLKNSGLYVLLERRSLRSSTEVSGSEGMARLIRKAKEQYDYVILDTPPMSAAPDTESLMEMVDASLLVVQQNAAPADVLNSAIHILKGAQSKFLGCVLNNVYTTITSGRSYGYGYGYGQGYGRYGKYGRYEKTQKTVE